MPEKIYFTKKESVLFFFKYMLEEKKGTEKITTKETKTYQIVKCIHNLLKAEGFKVTLEQVIDEMLTSLIGGSNSK